MQITRRKLFLLIVLTTILSTCQSQNSMIDKTVVKDLDIDKYLGTWYEIARFDHSFERNLVGVTANYSLRSDGKIKVINRGFKNTLDGKVSEAIGKAKIPNPKQPSKLKVSFFWFFYADYFVLELDNNYQWAIIGSSSDKYLWIIARTPEIDDKLYSKLLEILKNRGYDVNKLIKVKQVKS